VADDSDAESLGGQPKAGVTLDDVPEDEATLPAGHSDVDVDAAPRMTTQQQSATSELYTYEILTLFACFGCPLLSAYLLHAIRAQLSRPSEGLVSNYNLTIFLLVSELRVFSHMLKLLQARTLHLQRIVNANPYRSASGTGGDAERLDDILARLASLETKPTTQEPLPPRDPKADSAEKTKQEAAITRDVRNSIQPELDALNRAVRRYEKKATLLQYQTESRFSAVEARLDDAIALAAAAAKNSASHQNSLAWAIDSLVRILLFPFNAIVKILLLPLHALQALLSRKKPASAAVKTSRAGRSSSGKAPAQARYSGDRVPSRVSKR
jgi:hypothetical protein